MKKTKLTKKLLKRLINEEVNRMLNEAETHTVKSGENLTLIAQKYETTVDAIRKANDLSSDMIQPGQELKIVWPYSGGGTGPAYVDGESQGAFAHLYRKAKKWWGGEEEKEEEEAPVVEEPPSYQTSNRENEVVAATLLGEGGTLTNGVALMRKVLTVINNRAEYRGMTRSAVSLARCGRQKCFSFWDGLSTDRGIAWAKTTGRWEEAMRIVIENDADPIIGSSTYYYNPDEVRRPPKWARTTNRCWVEIHRDAGEHIYGRGGTPWDKCYP